jgi:hypothetical protein
MSPLSNTLNLTSLSSGIILGTTLYRNNKPNLLKKCVAELGYAAAHLIALAESVVAIVSYAGSFALYPLFTNQTRANLEEWVWSSLFDINWALVYFILNPFVERLAADEPTARAMVRARSLDVPVRGFY